jgi:hypothetical protein
MATDDAATAQRVGSSIPSDGASSKSGAASSESKQTTTPFLALVAVGKSGSFDIQPATFFSALLPPTQLI